MFRTGSGKPQITLVGTKDGAVLLWPPGAIADLYHIRPSSVSAQCKKTYRQPAAGFAAETEDLSNRKERKIARTLVKVH